MKKVYALVVGLFVSPLCFGAVEGNLVARKLEYILSHDDVIARLNEEIGIQYSTLKPHLLGFPDEDALFALLDAENYFVRLTADSSTFTFERLVQEDFLSLLRKADCRTKAVFVSYLFIQEYAQEYVVVVLEILQSICNELEDRGTELNDAQLMMLSALVARGRWYNERVWYEQSEFVEGLLSQIKVAVAGYHSVCRRLCAIL